MAVLIPAASGCAIGGERQTYVAPAPSPELFAGTDALVISSTFNSLIEPRELVRGPGEGARAAAADWFIGGFEGMSGSGGGGGGEVGVVLLILAGTPIAAVVGAARARSDEEIDTTAEIYKTAPSRPESHRSLAQRIAQRVRNAAPKRWNCVAVTTPAEMNPCPHARSPLALTVETKALTGVWDGRIDPDFTVDVFVKAELDRGALEPFEMRWRYIGEKESYFDLAGNDGALLSARIDSILDEFATAVTRDAILDPKPYAYEVWGDGVYAGTLVEPVIGAVRRDGFRSAD